jgi:FlaG/FlaF family flagellin (archaellin)
MPPHSLFNADDRAVSPASAVMLVTVIGVALAATAGGVVLGVGVQGGDDPPAAALTADVDASGDTVTVTHEGDDAVSAPEYEVVAYADGAVVDRTPVGTDRLAPDERVTVDYATGGDHAVDELRVVHAPSESVVATAALADPVRDFDGWA